MPKAVIQALAEILIAAKLRFFTDADYLLWQTSQ